MCVVLRPPHVDGGRTATCMHRRRAIAQLRTSHVCGCCRSPLGSDLRTASELGSNLTGAHLDSANLRAADLTNTTLDSAFAREASFIDLSEFYHS